MNNDDRFPCGSPKYPANTVKPIKPSKMPCGLFYALADLYGVNTKLPNAMDSLMVAIRASATNFKKLARLKTLNNLEVENPTENIGMPVSR